MQFLNADKSKDGSMKLRIGVAALSDIKILARVLSVAIM